MHPMRQSSADARPAPMNRHASIPSITARCRPATCRPETAGEEGLRDAARAAGGQTVVEWFWVQYTGHRSASSPIGRSAAVSAGAGVVRAAVEARCQVRLPAALAAYMATGVHPLSSRSDCVTLNRRSCRRPATASAEVGWAHTLPRVRNARQYSHQIDRRRRELRAAAHEPLSAHRFASCGELGRRP